MKELRLKTLKRFASEAAFVDFREGFRNITSKRLKCRHHYSKDHSTLNISKARTKISLLKMSRQPTEVRPWMQKQQKTK